MGITSLSGIQDLGAFRHYSSVVEEQAPDAAVNARSDVSAKQALCAWLTAQGYTHARVCSVPADVTARKDDADWFFEVKFTRAKAQCFGAATLTEWIAATKDPDHFRFVIAYQRNDEWRFDCYTPEQFMGFSSVPPFKVYFSVPLDGRPSKGRSARSRRIHLTEKRLGRLARQFEELRTLQDLNENET